MPIARTTQHVTIAQSGQVSGNIDLTGAGAIGILAPALTSCQLFLQGNFDTTSAGFLRVWDAAGNFEWSWDLETGSNAVVSQDVLWPFTQARIELSVPQADVRSFAIVTRR